MTGQGLALWTQGLKKTYNGVLVFQNVNLELEKGGVYCLTAPSGAGKTTLFRILMGLETADEGSVDGSGKGRTAAVFQEDRLCPGLDVVGNIRLVNPHASVSMLRQEAGRLLPQDCLEKPVFQFSGGMGRRAALLRALLSEGELLLFDEPFNGLDEAARRTAIDYVREKRNGRTLLFTTHRVEEAQAMEARQFAWDGQGLCWQLP